MTAGLESACGSIARRPQVGDSRATRAGRWPSAERCDKDAAPPPGARLPGRRPSQGHLHHPHRRARSSTTEVSPVVNVVGAKHHPSPRPPVGAHFLPALGAACPALSDLSLPDEAGRRTVDDPSSGTAAEFRRSSARQEAASRGAAPVGNAAGADLARLVLRIPPSRSAMRWHKSSMRRRNASAPLR